MKLISNSQYESLKNFFSRVTFFSKDKQKKNYNKLILRPIPTKQNEEKYFSLIKNGGFWLS